MTKAASALAALVILALAFPARGTRIETEPAGASVTVRGEQVCRATPCDVPLAGRSRLVVQKGEKRVEVVVADGAFDPLGCVLFEATAVGACLVGPLCILFGLGTIGIVAPLTAATPLPVGTCGIAMGVGLICAAPLFAVAGPFVSRTTPDRIDINLESGDVHATPPGSADAADADERAAKPRRGAGSDVRAQAY